METKNLGLVKAIFRQSTAPVRTDVWWFDTVNLILKSWDISLLQWREESGGGGGTVEYTQVDIPANSYLDIVIGLLADIRGIIIEYVGERASLFVEGVGRCLITGATPPATYEVTSDEQGDVDTIGISYEIKDSGANLVLRVTVDSSSVDSYYFSYRVETKPKY